MLDKNIPPEAPKALADAIVEVDGYRGRNGCGGFQKDGASW
jgi:hypothetical protein